MQDTIFIEGLSVNASIGIFDWEKRLKQELIIDCDMHFPLDQAGQSNDIMDTVSYAEVAQLLDRIATTRHHDLLEHLAQNMIEQCFECFPLKHIKLKLSKPAAVPQAQRVGIIVERTRA